MEEILNEREDRDVRCASDGKRMFLKLGATAFAALALNALTAKFVAANDNRFLDLPMSPQAQAVYDGEENTVQGGIDFAGAGGTPPDAARQTFDEPLTRSQVLAIAGLFIES